MSRRCWLKTLNKIAWCLLAALLLCGCSGDSYSPAASPPSPYTPPPPPPAPPAPPCTHTISWTNPTEDIGGRTLRPDELIAATLYVTLIPFETQVFEESIVALPPYALMWVITGIEFEGTWQYDLTVSNEIGESDPDSASKECVRE